MRTDGVTMAGEGDRRSAPDDRRALWRALCARMRRASTPARRRTRRKRTKPSAPPASSARPTRCRAHLDADQAQLYELIWKRAVASQMESAELERTTVDVDFRRRQDHLARHRLGHVVRWLPHALSGRQATTRRRRRRLQAAEAGAGRNRSAWRRSVPSSISPSRRRAIPKPAWCASWKNSASAGLRPMPAFFRCCATAPMCGMDRNRFIPEDKGRLVTAFLANFFKRYVEYDFTADLEEKLDEVSGGRTRLEAIAARFLEGFLRRHRRHQGPENLRTSSTTLDEILGPHIFPQQRRWQRSAQMPHLRRRPN